MTLSGCHCLRCDACNGSGHIWVDERGRALSGPRDDLDDLETCDNCRGTGFVEECDACADYRERREAEDDDYN